MKTVLIDTNIYSLAMKVTAGIVDALRKIDQIGFSVVSIFRRMANNRLSWLGLYASTPTSLCMPPLTLKT